MSNQILCIVLHIYAFKDFCSYILCWNLIYPKSPKMYHKIVRRINSYIWLYSSVANNCLSNQIWSIIRHIYVVNAFCLWAFYWILISPKSPKMYHKNCVEQFCTKFFANPNSEYCSAHLNFSIYQQIYIVWKSYCLNVSKYIPQNNMNHTFVVTPWYRHIQHLHHKSV